MAVALVCASIFWIHVFPASDIVSSTLTSHTIVTVQIIHFHKHCQIEFREYVQTHETRNNIIVDFPSSHQ